MKKQNNQKSSLTVMLPVYNEEKNIENILKAILTQKAENFDLQKIALYSDVSTDKTHVIVEKLRKKYPVIQLIKGTQRKGKYMLVNQAFRDCTTDVLVVLDADIALVGNHFLQNLAHVIQTDSKAMLVAAHQILLRPKTFIGKVIYGNFFVWNNVRLSIPNYDSPRNYSGAATAYRGSFARSMHIPSQLSDPHAYIYIMAAQQKGFRYCRKAEILQWSIATFKDFNKFLDRAIGKRDGELEKIFKTIDMKKLNFVPFRCKIIGVTKSFREEPLYTPLSFLLTLYMKIRPVRKTTSSVWEVVSSTKKPITV